MDYTTVDPYQRAVIEGALEAGYYDAQRTNHIIQAAEDPTASHFTLFLNDYKRMTEFRIMGNNLIPVIDETDTGMELLTRWMVMEGTICFILQDRPSSNASFFQQVKKIRRLMQGQASSLRFARILGIQEDNLPSYPVIKEEEPSRQFLSAGGKEVLPSRQWRVQIGFLICYAGLVIREGSEAGFSYQRASLEEFKQVLFQGMDQTSVTIQGHTVVATDITDIKMEGEEIHLAFHDEAIILRPGEELYDALKTMLTETEGEKPQKKAIQQWATKGKKRGNSRAKRLQDK